MYRTEHIQGLALTYLHFDGFHQILYKRQFFFFVSAFFLNIHFYERHHH